MAAAAQVEAMAVRGENKAFVFASLLETSPIIHLICLFKTQKGFFTGLSADVQKVATGFPRVLKKS